MIKTLLSVVAFASIPMLSMARGEDLKNCRFSDGQYIQATLCQRLRQEAIEERAHRADQEEQLRQQRVAQEEKQRVRNEEAAERHRQWELAEQERKKEQAERQAKSDAEYARYQKEEARREKLAAEQTKAKKERCGNDYGIPRIGMTLSRAQECAGTFKLKGQINRADGIVSTYTGSGKYLHVMDNRVVSWGPN